LGDANPAVELLTTSRPVRARVIATELEGLNARRKLLCDQVLPRCRTATAQRPGAAAQPVIVLAQAAWPGGVIGIVASRLVERYPPSGDSFFGPAR